MIAKAMPNPASHRYGRLYVVATPIGNREDLSPRAIIILKHVGIIACEDTRHSLPLLNLIGAKGSLMAVHEHNEQQASAKLIARLQEGTEIALISDAGTPLINDPGFRLVQAAIQAGITIVPIPGPSAIIAALSVAGLPTDRFCFEGFLPVKSMARRAALATLRQDPRTLVFFEAKHRIVECLHDLGAIFGEDRQAAVARELTKTFETVLRGSIAELIACVTADADQQLGEFVIVVNGAPTADAESAKLLEGERILRLLMAELPASQAVRLAAEITGTPKNALYKLANAT